MNPIELLRDRLGDTTTQQALADELGVSLGYLHDVLKKRREPGPKMLKALRLRKVVTYELMRR